MSPLTLADHVKQAKQAMDKAVEAVKREFSTVRTGKATTSLLDLVRVEAYGSDMPLNQVASVAAPEPKLLTIQPWDKSVLKAIEKAILASDLGLTPSNDGNIIPSVTTRWCSRSWASRSSAGSCGATTCS